MTTPAINNTNLSFATVRYYTQYDPYYYTVDNRPLQDISSNDSILATAADAARRATMIGEVGGAIFNQVTYGTSLFTHGLDVTNPSANVARIGVGAVYQQLNINGSDARQIVKQGMSPYTKDFNVPAPITAGQSIVYLIQGRYADLSAATASFPLYDTANTALPETCLFGELQLALKAGTPAATGSQVTPTPDSGYFALYNITVAFGATTFTVISDAAAPASPSLDHHIPQILPLNGASATVIADTPVVALAKGSTQDVSFFINLANRVVSQYKPIKFRMRYSPSITGNAFAVRIKYQVFTDGSLLTPASYTSTTIENITVAGAANTLQTYIFTLGTIPPSAFVGQSRVNVLIERIGADASDTNTGVLNILSVYSFQ